MDKHSAIISSPASKCNQEAAPLAPYPSFSPPSLFPSSDLPVLLSCQSVSQPASTVVQMCCVPPDPSLPQPGRALGPVSNFPRSRQRIRSPITAGYIWAGTSPFLSTWQHGSLGKSPDLFSDQQPLHLLHLSPFNPFRSPTRCAFVLLHQPGRAGWDTS